MNPSLRRCAPTCRPLCAGWGRLLTGLLILLLPRLTPAQTLATRRYTIAEGLPQSTVYAVAEDGAGQLWIGTQGGVAWFDGRRFRTLDTRQGLPESHVTAVAPGADGTLWLGHRYGAVSAVRHARGPGGEAGRSGPGLADITRIRPRGYAGTARVRQVLPDTDNHGIWLATAGDGLYRLRWEPGADTVVTHLTAVAGDLPADSLHQLLPGPSGQLWVVTVGGVAVLDGATGHRLPASTAAMPPALRGRGLRTLFRVSDRLYWGASTTGLLRLDRPDPRQPWTLTRYTAADGLCSTDIRRALQDHLGRVWVFGAGGVSRHEAGAPPGTFACYTGDDLMGDVTAAALEDREGSLWMVQDEGLVQHVADERFAVYDEHDGLTGADVYAILPVAPGTYWVGTHAGLSILTPNAPPGQRGRPGHQRPGGGAPNFIRALFRDSRGRIWLGSRRGGVAWCETTGDAAGRWHELTGVPSLAGGHILSFAEDRRGRLWIGSYANGLTVLDGATLRAQQFGLNGLNPVPGNRLAQGTIWRTYCDRRGAIWLGSDNHGLVQVLDSAGTVCFRRVDGQRGRLSVSSLSEGTAGQLWLGTIGQGLLRFDTRTGRLHAYPQAHLSAQNPFLIQADTAAGGVWVGTNHGLDFFDARLGRVRRSYGRDEGFRGQETNQGAVLLEPDGGLWVGTVNGLMHYDPTLARPNRLPPRTRLLGIRLFLRDTILAPGVALPYRLNHLTFDYVGVSLANPDRVRYQYRLIGFDAAWAGPLAATAATYTNLPPGTYRFEVRAANPDGVWNPHPAAFAFTIRPPWWRTWWAYVLYAITIAAALWLARAYTLARAALRADLQLERQALHHMRELDRVKTDFFTNVSHELRTPLTLILGPAAEVEADESAPAAVRARGGVVLRQARKLLTLITQLLDLSKLEAGALHLQTVSGEASAFVQQILLTFADLATTRGIHLRAELPDGPVPLRFDPPKLEEILTNLLANALRFTPTGGTVTLTLTAHDAAPPHPGEVLLQVTDSGPGIAPEHLAHVFDRFYQVPESTAAFPEAGSGTGIGLALVRELTALHGGRVDVTSTPGQGTTFTVRLPRLPLADAQRAIATPDLPATLPAMTASAPDQPRAIEALSERPAPDNEAPVVVIIEDNADIRAFIADVLTPAGYQLLTAPDGATGLALALAEVPDLVVSDVMMPGALDGFAVCRALKASPATSHIPVVLLTARSGADDRLTGLEGGADAYVAKPFNPRELRAQVQNLLRLGQLARIRFAPDTVVTPNAVFLAEAPAEPLFEPVPTPDMPPAATDPLARHTAAVAGLPSLDQAFLHRVETAVEAHLDDGEFSVDDLASAVNLSRTQLHRKLKALTGQAASDYIRLTRLHRAHALLAGRVGTVAEIAYRVGFNSPAHFSTAFSRQFGYPPSEIGRAVASAPATSAG